MKLQCICLISLPILLLLSSCSRPEADDKGHVIIYTSWDHPHSHPILSLFEKKTGIEVQAVYDTEAAKTTGLVNRLIAEKSRPRADVFWNSEVIRTIVLKHEGVIESYKSPMWHETPEQYRDPDAYWTGFAARARVVLYNTELISDPPSEFMDATDKKWKGHFALANPLFGTTSTNIAVWYDLWGATKTQSYLKDMRSNGVKIVPGNGAARDMVAGGEIPFCFTDTDDAWGAIINKKPVKMLFPNQGDGENGTLLMPNTVCLIQNAPNPENAKQLIDFLLSREVASILAHSKAAQIPVKESVDAPDWVASWAKKKYMKADFEAAASHLNDAMHYVNDHFLQ